MTQWKIGDRAEVIVEIDNYAVGEIATVIDLDEDGDPILSGDTISSCGWSKSEEYFRRLPPSTYEKIQINGKLYNLVPVEAS